jgi:7-carboxy-7-deazaguanine synthase
MLKPVQYDSAADTLRITEIFYSLQGESRTVGWPTVFVRLTGCPLRCNYCDSEYAFSGGEEMSLSGIEERVAAFGPRYVCVTGGEPLAQRASLSLLTQLCDAGYKVSLETSGALDISRVDPRVVVVMDLKSPSSTELDKNLLANLEHLKAGDQLKFVLADRADYDWAVQLVRDEGLEQRCEVLFSPIYGALAPRELAQWILDDRLQVRFQLQLHKLIWGEEPGR